MVDWTFILKHMKIVVVVTNGSRKETFLITSVKVKNSIPLHFYRLVTYIYKAGFLNIEVWRLDF